MNQIDYEDLYPMEPIEEVKYRYKNAGEIGLRILNNSNKKMNLLQLISCFYAFIKRGNNNV
jgi:hypothetical protein